MSYKIENLNNKFYVCYYGESSSRIGDINTIINIDGDPIGTIDENGIFNEYYFTSVSDYDKTLYKAVKKFKVKYREFIKENLIKNLFIE